MAYNPANPNGQAAMAASAPVVIASNQTAVPVSAVFWQATQPVSGPFLTDSQLRATPVPVSLTSTTITGSVAVTGTFWQATQPVSGTVTVNVISGFATEATLAARIPVNGQALMAASVPVTLASNQSALPVTGTFWQTTQPVSLTSTTITGSVAVTGTFWQATQPVSFTQQALPANQSVNVAQMGGVATSMNTGVRDAGTQRVTIATNDSVPVTGTFWQTTQPVSGTFWQATQPVSLTSTTITGTVAVTHPVLTKGTQGANGVTTQDLKDAGRNAVHFYMVIPVLATATDVLQSLTGTKAGATVTATTTPAVVTTGKTLRITRLAATYIATATSGYGIVRLRFNTAGVVAITSPAACTMAVGAGTPATANSAGMEEASLAEGWEFAAGTGIGISVQGFAAATATAVGYILASVTGYEY